MVIRPTRRRGSRCSRAGLSGPELGRVETGLGRVGAKLHLQQDTRGQALLGGDPLQPLGQAQAVDGMDGAEATQHGAGLVGLEPADEVPVEERQISQLLLLAHRLLEAAFSEAQLPQGCRLAHQISRMALRNRQQLGWGGNACRRAWSRSARVGRNSSAAAGDTTIR